MRRRQPVTGIAAAAFTLLEVILAAIVLILGITTALTALQRGFLAVDTARTYTFASQLMQSEMERLRLKSWNQLEELQRSSDRTVAVPSVAGTGASSVTCTRTIADLRTDMKEITLVTTWRGIDGRAHTARFVTRYAKSGLYDYFYTAH